MENSADFRKSISEALTQHECGIQRVQGTRSALRALHEEGIRYFLLDIDMGPERRQAGLDVLQQLLAHDPDTCVVILSSHTVEYRERALSAGAESVVARTKDTEQDVRKALQHFYRHLIRKAQMRSDRLEPDSASSSPASAGVLELDANEAEFQRLSENPKWVEKHSGMYAGFADGHLVDVFDTREECVEALIAGYANRPRFITRVDTPVPEFELPGIYDIEFY